MDGIIPGVGRLQTSKQGCLHTDEETWGGWNDIEEFPGFGDGLHVDSEDQYGNYCF